MEPEVQHINYRFNTDIKRPTTVFPMINLHNLKITSINRHKQPNLEGNALTLLLINKGRCLKKEPFSFNFIVYFMYFLS